MAIKSSDQISIVDLTDGYSVILTNDSYTFPGNVSAAIAGSTTTTIIAMCGATQVAASVDLNDVVKPSGVTVTKDTDTTQPTLTISVDTTVTAGGTVDIPVELDGGNITIHKLFTFQIAFKGTPGSDGFSAIWYTGTGITGTSTTATIFSGSGVANAKVGDMYLNTSTQNTYRCTVAGAASVAKWIYVSNIKGATGGTGPAGADAITMTITSSNGTIFKNTGVSTTLTAHVYQAGTELNSTQIAALGTILKGDVKVIIGVITMTKAETKTLLELLAKVPEHRTGNAIKYALRDVLFLGIFAILCGAETYTGMHTFSELHLEELRKYLELPNGVPSHDAFGDIFSRVDIAAVGKCFKLFTDSIKAGEGTDYVVALDGKTVRRSENGERKATHIETAYLSDLEIVLGQVAVDEKSNEITAIPKLLELLALKQCTVTIDAMGTHREMAGYERCSRHFKYAHHDKHWKYQHMLQLLYLQS